MIRFEDYDRISDTLMYLSDSITLNFTVTLSRKDRNGGRAFFHYETEYNSKYIGATKGRAIKRNMTFYFIIDNKNDFGNGFILRPQDVMILTTIMEQKLIPLYFDPNRRIYKIIDGKHLAITGEFESIIYPQSEYKVLSFIPIVCTYEDGTSKEGVRININKDFVDLDIDKFMGLYYILKNTDMYSAACSMTAYVKNAPYGVNVYSCQGLGGGATLPDDNYNLNDNNNGNFLNNIKEKR